MNACARLSSRTCRTKLTSFATSTRFAVGIENMIDMPERTLNKLFGFLRQNQGKLSKRARENEFAELTADEVSKIEQLFTRIVWPKRSRK